jgi:WD40 repeat protein
VIRRFWQLAPGAVAAGRDITGTVITGPMYVQVIAEHFDRLHEAIFDPGELYEQLDLAHFRGRAQLIARIDQHIAMQDRGYVVIRGEAGVGKSALAAHLVWTRACAFHFTRLRAGARNPVEARKSLAAQLIGGWRLADRFTPGDVFPPAADRPDWLAKVIRAAAAERDRLDRGRRPLVLVVDGLDEALPDPTDMDTGVPLGLPVPDALPAGVFIIATSRYGLPLTALRNPQRVGWSQITVEGQDNLADMRAYLRAALTGPAPDAELVDTLRRYHVSTDWFVDTLMDRCRGVWIYLRYVLDEIRSRIRSPLDVARLPAGLRGYYEQQIVRWAADERAWRRLHRPALAALAALQRPVTSDDLAQIIATSDGQPVAAGQVATWLDGAARAFLDVTRYPGRRAFYSVRHDSLRDMFTTNPDSDADKYDPVDAGLGDQLHRAWIDANQAITRWLIPVAHRGRREWASVGEYTLRYLATHAVAAGRIDDVIADLDYLVLADPDTLLPALRAVRTDEGRLIRAVYRTSASRHRSLPPSQRRYLLAVDAARYQAESLRRSLARPLSCKPKWATGTKVNPALEDTFTGHVGWLNVVACTVLPDGHSLVVTGSGSNLGRSEETDGTARVWDLATGTQHATLGGHTGGVTAAACTVLNGRPIAVTGDSGPYHGNGTLRLWDLVTGQAIGEPITGLQGQVNAVACTVLPDGRAVAVSGDSGIYAQDVNGTARVWDLTTGEQIATLEGHVGAVHAVACTILNNRPVAVTGDVGPHISIPDKSGRFINSSTGTVRVWDLATGKLICEPITGHAGWVNTVACAVLNGRPIIVTGDSGHRFGHDGTVRVWDLATGRPVGGPMLGHISQVMAVACTTLNGRAVAVAGDSGPGSGDGIVRVWDLATGQPVGEPIRSHTGWVRAVACTVLDGRPTAITGDSGSYFVGQTNSANGAVRVWDLADATRYKSLPGHADLVRAVACTVIHDRPVAVTGSGNDSFAKGTIRVWDLSSGEPFGAPITGGIYRVSALACTLLNTSPGAVTADAGWLRVWDLEDRHQLGERIDVRTDYVRSVACTVLNGCPIAVTGDSGDDIGVYDDDGTWMSSFDGRMRVWDLNTGRPIGEPIAHTGPVDAVACNVLPDGRVVAVSGDISHIGDMLDPGDHDEGRVRVWDLSTGGVIGEPISGAAGRIEALACTMLNGRPIGVLGSSNGSVQAFDLTENVQYGVLRGHVGPVTSVTCTVLGERTIAVTGGNDGTIRIWDLINETELAVLTQPASVAALAISQGGEIAVACGWEIIVTQLMASIQ